MTVYFCTLTGYGEMPKSLADHRRRKFMSLLQAEPDIDVIPERTTFSESGTKSRFECDFCLVSCFSEDELGTRLKKTMAAVKKSESNLGLALCSYALHDCPDIYIDLWLKEASNEPG